MKFLNKNNNSQIIKENLKYSQKSDRDKIREVLIKEQKGFCAYSEKFLNKTDSVHIEHFDGRLKPTADDNYYNWYAVAAWMNENKPKKIEQFLPILAPQSIDLSSRITYNENIFMSTSIDDKEAENLIKYLGFNKYELTVDRNRHVKRIKCLLKDLLDNDKKQLVNWFKEHPEDLCFPTALEADLNISLDEIIEKL